jgi:eukaryotic-like serine/threonine-protein kinase
MPFVEGESLREKLTREKQLSIPEAIQIGREVADALAYAHEKGVVHRDVKPANIMLDSGHAVVTDFGIALATQQADPDRLTATGVSPGSPHYMSPEQAAGEGDMDGRSDIYSLGCVLYEVLAGDPPFTGRMPQAILAKKLTETPPGVRVVRDTVPTALERVVSRCLVRVPADRFKTAGELRDALDAAAAGQVLNGGAPAATWKDGAEGPAPSRRTALVAGVLAGILGLTTMVGFLTTRIYDLKLGIPADFTPSRMDFPVVGLQALVPELFYAFVALLA